MKPQCFTENFALTNIHTYFHMMKPKMKTNLELELDRTRWNFKGLCVCVCMHTWAWMCIYMSIVPTVIKKRHHISLEPELTIMSQSMWMLETGYLSSARPVITLNH